MPHLYGHVDSFHQLLQCTEIIEISQIHLE